MKVSSTVNLRSDKLALENVQQSVELLLKGAFDKAKASNNLAVFENTLLVYMGLLKVRFARLNCKLICV